MQSGVKRNKRLKTFNQKNFEKHLGFAKKFLYHGDMEGAWDAFHDALVINFESEDAKSGMRIAGYWKERKVKLNSLSDFFEQGEFLLREFKSFRNNFLVQNNIEWTQGIKSVEHWVYHTAYSLFKRYGETTNNEKDPNILLKQGFCLKTIGDYETARDLLEEAVNISKDNSRILAQLADIYGLVNEEKHSKLFFREAFFISAQDIDLDSLESVMIKKIIEELTPKGYAIKELKEWIPVYGTILGLFFIKKELKPIEVGLLKQSIYTLKNQLTIGDIDKKILVPRLINHYLRLLEHLVTLSDNQKEIDEVLLNVKLLDEKIYNLYLN